MRERDYILVSTLTQVRSVRACALHLCAFQETSKVISKEELQHVHQILSRWEDGLAAMVKT